MKLLGAMLKNHRISTTISQRHWELLNKYAEKFETQQKALEHALECLEDSSKQSAILTEEEKFCMYIIKTKSACIFEKNAFKLLIETSDIELLQKYIIQNKPVEYVIELYFQKPLKECSLKEVIDGIIIVAKIINWFDTVDYTDNGSHYTLIITHSFGPNASKINIVVIESVLKTYGVKTESTVSPKTIFVKILKN